MIDAVANGLTRDRVVRKRGVKYVYALDLVKGEALPDPSAQKTQIRQEPGEPVFSNAQQLKRAMGGDGWTSCVGQR